MKLLIFAASAVLLLVSPVAVRVGSELTAGDDYYAVIGGGMSTIPNPGILANDSPFPTDLKAINLITTPRYGDIGATPIFLGGFTYTPRDPHFMGADSFSYCLARAGECISNVATVRLDIAQPKARPDRYSTPADTVLTVERPSVLTNDDQIEDAGFSITRSSSHGHLIYTPIIGGFIYNPDNGYVGEDSFDYCLSVRPGNGDCISAAATVTIQVGGTRVSRVAGADRYEGAVKIAEQTHPGTSAALVVASGENYPDALSAGPVAVREKAPLLLVQGKSVPAVVAAKISKLAPTKVTVVGGVNTISDDVLNQIRSIVPSGATVTRVAGVDRYEVSRKLAESFGTAPREYLATGTNFPDALSAGAAAGSVGAPVLLVNGPQPAADAATLETVKKLKSTAITLAGGSDSLSSGIENSLKALATVNRVQGVDRYATSVVLNKETFASSTTAYLATGTNYPDALVGGVIAGANKAPLYVVPGTCVPQAVLDEFTRLGATKIVLLGGENSLSPDVEKLVPCT